MAYTAQNLITDVLLDMGVIADEATPTASQIVTGLTKFNDLLETWNIDTLALYGATEYVIPFVANKVSYTIGPSGDLDIPRPNNITQAFVRNNFGSPMNQVDIPLAILTNAEYAALPFKSWTGGYPFIGVWFDQTYPLITAYVNPVPTGSDYSLVFWNDNPLGALTQFTVLSFPPGYKRAIKYALYIELAESYTIEVPQSITTKAASSKAAIDKQNLQLNELLTSDSALYNIYSNQVYPIRR